MTVFDPTAIVYAFDIGPSNALIDAASPNAPLNTLGYDAGRPPRAQPAASTTCCSRELLDDAYYALPAPKSTGKELFHGGYVTMRFCARRPHG